MHITYCLSFCDTLQPLQDARWETSQPGARTQALVSFLCTEAGFLQCDRIMVGSNFCPSEFLYACQHAKMEELAFFCRSYSVPLTLCIPQTPQRELERIKVRIAQLLEDYRDLIDEVCVNDLGMLGHINDAAEQDLVIGRLFSKDLRDPRYSEGFPALYRPALLSGQLAELKALYPRIAGAEFDPAGYSISFSGVPQGVTPALHIPYFFLTTGRICEAASLEVGAADELEDAGTSAEEPAAAYDLEGRLPMQLNPDSPRRHRLRVDTACAHQCSWHMNSYRLHPCFPGTLVDNEERDLYFTKRGKTVYCLNEGVLVDADASLSGYRLIYTPRHFGWNAERSAREHSRSS